MKVRDFERILEIQKQDMELIVEISKGHRVPVDEIIYDVDLTTGKAIIVLKAHRPEETKR